MARAGDWSTSTWAARGAVRPRGVPYVVFAKLISLCRAGGCARDRRPTPAATRARSGAAANYAAGSLQIAHVLGRPNRCHGRHALYPAQRLSGPNAERHDHPDFPESSSPMNAHRRLNSRLPVLLLISLTTILATPAARSAPEPGFDMQNDPMERSGSRSGWSLLTAACGWRSASERRVAPGSR